MANGPELLLKPADGLNEERRGLLRQSTALLVQLRAQPAPPRREGILRAQVAPGSLGRYPRKLTAAPSENSSSPTPPGLRETPRGAAPPRLRRVLPWF